MTPWTVAHQTPLFLGFSGQVYWSGLPFPLPGDLPDPGIEPVSPALAGGFSTTELPGKPSYYAESDTQKCYSHPNNEKKKSDNKAIFILKPVRELRLDNK